MTSKTILSSPRVVWCDDDRPHGGGWFVTLQVGWAFDDAVPPGSPYEGQGNATHCHSYATVAEAMRAIAKAELCACRRCKGEPLPRD